MRARQTDRALGDTCRPVTTLTLTSGIAPRANDNVHGDAPWQVIAARVCVYMRPPPRGPIECSQWCPHTCQHVYEMRSPRLGVLRFQEVDMRTLSLAPVLGLASEGDLLLAHISVGVRVLLRAQGRALRVHACGTRAPQSREEGAHSSWENSSPQREMERGAGRCSGVRTSMP